MREPQLRSHESRAQEQGFDPDPRREHNSAVLSGEGYMNVRMMVWGVVAAGAIALGNAVALAQNVPAQFVVSGKAAEQIQDFTTINLATAERIAETCEKLATEQNVAITMYVLD